MNKETDTIDAFFTCDRANEGIDMPLLLPDGTDSGQSMRIRGVDSDAFRKATTRKTRRMAEIERLPEEEQYDAINKANAELLASLVASWTLKTPFTPENVVALLLKSGTAYEQVNTLAGDRQRFFGKR